MQSEEGCGLNQSLVVDYLLWIVYDYGAKRFTSDNSLSYDSLDISRSLFFLKFFFRAICDVVPVFNAVSSDF